MEHRDATRGELYFYASFQSILKSFHPKQDTEATRTQGGEVTECNMGKIKTLLRIIKKNSHCDCADIDHLTFRSSGT